MEGARLTFSTFGIFRVTRPDGTDVTPRSQKACGLLALLLDAPKNQRSRSVLQDKLWSDRAPAQGAGSLRHALSEIRKTFGEDRDVLDADTRMVRLDREAIDADLHEPEAIARARRAGAIFLEGLDVRDAEFEDWLRDRRHAFEAAPVPSPHERTPLSASSDEKPPVLLLASSSTGLGLFAEHIIHSIAKGISSIGAVDVRWGDGQLDQDAGIEAYLLDATERSLGEGAAIRVQLSTFPGGTICWQTSEILPDRDPGETSGTLARLINEGVDRTAAAFAGDRLFARMERRDGLFSSIREMWTSVGRNPKELSRRFEERFASEGRGVHLAWEAFVSCFIVGERRGDQPDPANARDLIRRALELEPHNAVVLALASHVYGFVLRQHEVAHDLAERSIRLDRNNSLGWTFLGVAKLNLGLRDEAYRSVVHAREIAGEGAHRPFVDGVAAMVASLSGHGRESISIGETVHALRPDFAAPLRYLLASYLATGDIERARLTALRLRELEPDFDTSLLAEPDYPVEPLRRSGILDLKKLPKLK